MNELLKELDLGNLKLIGLAGIAKSGKSTTADMLTKYYGFKQLSFAEPLKSMAQVIVDLYDPGESIEDVKDTFIPSLNVSYRTILQTLGTEWGRLMINKKIWLDMLIHRLFEAYHSQGCHNIVITDVRFPNEVDLVDRLGGMLMYITRDSQDNIIEDTHASETSLALTRVADLTLQNNGTLTQLEETVKGAYRRVFQGESA